MKKSYSDCARRFIALALCAVFSFFEIVPAYAAEIDPGAGAASVQSGGLTISSNDGRPIAYGVTASPTYELYTWKNIIYVQTDRPLTISGTTTTHTLQIVKGTHADVTLNNVSITNSGAPAINVEPNGSAKTDAERTQLYLTLADGSQNTLNAKGASHAAIRVTYGGILTIDDSRRNVDQNGSLVEVVSGRISRTCTLADGVSVTEGTPGWKMDSAAPGALLAYGGQNGAAIGGNTGENSGIIRINGGNITADAHNNGGSNSAGAAIGGGYKGGAGCSLDGGGITVNGGVINARASYHGAALGAAWHSEKAGVGHFGTIPGDITINGGYITAVGAEHGNGFGGACCAQANVGHGAAGTPHEIRITGGTLIPKSNNNGSQWDVGALGGKVIVTGGSFRPAPHKGTGTGYSIQGASVESGDGTTLTMVTIDLSSYSYPGPDGQDVYLKKGDYLDSYKVKIDGTEIEYGLAMKLDDTMKLYFWLPASAAGKTVAIEDVKLQIADSTGAPTSGPPIVSNYPFTLDSIPPAGAATEPQTKRYVKFVVDPEKFSPELHDKLYKTYDGLTFTYADLYQGIVDQEIVVPEPENETIDFVEKMEASAVRLRDKDNKPTGEASMKEGFKTTGSYEITVNYSEFAEDEEFSKTFWGHQTTVESIITPAESRVENVLFKASYDESSGKPNKILLTANVYPGEGEALTCEAPDGMLQFYINGTKMGDPVPVRRVIPESTPGQDDAEDAPPAEYEYSLAGMEYDLSKHDYIIGDLGDTKFTVIAKYLGGTNYNASEGNADQTIEPDAFPYTETPAVIPTVPETSSPLPPLPFVSYQVIEKPDDSGSVTLHGHVEDSMTVSVMPYKKDEPGDAEFFKALVNKQYHIEDRSGKQETLTLENIKIFDSTGTKPLDSVDLTKIGSYVVTAVATDSNGNTTTLHLAYQLININVDTNDDGKPDINIDTDGDGKPDINVDTDGDGEPDINITEGDSWKPDINIDTDGNGKPDINIDTNGDGKPDLNIVDTDGDGEPDKDVTWPAGNPPKPNVNVDTDGDGKPDINVDTDGDGKPDKNIDTDGDGKPDINIDTDDDGTPDINIDTDGDGEPDINIDKTGNGQPDINIDTDGDGKPDINVDTDGDGQPDDHIVPVPSLEIKPRPTPGPDQPGDPTPNKPLRPESYEIKEENGEKYLYAKYSDNITRLATVGKMEKQEFAKILSSRYACLAAQDMEGVLDVDTIEIIDKDGNAIEQINLAEAASYTIRAKSQPMTSQDAHTTIHSKAMLELHYTVIGLNEVKEGAEIGTPRPDIDTNGDGYPDLNITPENPEKPGVNIDADGDGIPDHNIDTTGDGEPDKNVLDEKGELKKDSVLHLPQIAVNPKNPEASGDKTPLTPVEFTTGEENGESYLYANYSDRITRLSKNEKLSGEQLKELIQSRYDFSKKSSVIGEANEPLEIDWDTLEIRLQGQPVTEIDLSKAAEYSITLKSKVIEDHIGGLSEHKEAVLHLTYNIVEPNDLKQGVETDQIIPDVDTDGDGYPDINVTVNGQPELNIDTSGNGEPDVNIDTDGDGIPDQNIDTTGDGKADTNLVRPTNPGGSSSDDSSSSSSGPAKPNTSNTTDKVWQEILNDQDHFAYVQGYPDGSIRPNANITRAEVATIFFRLMNEQDRNKYLEKNNEFSDVSQEDWYNTAVSTLTAADILKGYPNGDFRPNNGITRAEFAAVTARFLSDKPNAVGFSDTHGHWAETEICLAAGAGWVRGYEDGSFHPDQLITRAEAVTLINRMLNRDVSADHMLQEMTVWPDNRPGAWYYEAMQEAGNSHQYTRLQDKTETWTVWQTSPDWSALER